MKMSMKIQSKTVRQAFRDWLLGLGMFVVMALGLSADHQSWGPSTAVASSPGWSQPHEMATPAASNKDPLYFAAMYQAPTGTGTVGRTTALVILGLSFSLLFSFNLFILRHLRRVYAIPQGAWTRGR